MKKISIVLFSLLMAACVSTPKATTTQVPETSETSSSIATSNGIPDIGTVRDTDIEAQKLATNKLAADKLAAEIQALQKQSVYFDVDKFSVNSEFIDVVRQQAAFIKLHPQDMVTVEGNADERGSAEYNLALGDKRAYAVQKALELLGVASTQIEAASLGEETPRLSCHEEKCWQENRRVDFAHKFN
jgi:peptidoglycan-associated lipoprotein